VGKVFITTSPNGKKGMAYSKYQSSFESKSNLMLHMPSHWVNVNLSSHYLREKYKEDPATFDQEFYADFIDAKRSYIRDEFLVKACEDKRITNEPIGSSNINYFVGVDPALSTDSFTIVISHWDTNQNFRQGREEYAMYPQFLSFLSEENTDDILVFDYIKSFTPKSGKSLDPDDVFEEIKQIFRRFRIAKILADQWSEEFVKKYFNKIGYGKKIEFIAATADRNSMWAKSFRLMVENGRLLWSPFAIEERDGEETTFTEEIITLEQTTKSKLIKVEAPVGLHDDRFSAACKAIYLATKYKDKIRTIPTPIINKGRRLIEKRKLQQHTGRTGKKVI
jgi:hypothetical protein